MAKDYSKEGILKRHAKAKADLVKKPTAPSLSAKKATKKKVKKMVQPVVEQEVAQPQEVIPAEDNTEKTTIMIKYPDKSVKNFNSFL